MMPNATLATLTAPIRGWQLSARRPPRKRRPKRSWRQRDAEDSKHFNLEMDVRELNQQILALTEWRQTLQSQQLLPQHSTSERCLKLVVELHDVAAHMNEHTPLEMAKFMEGVMDENVLVNALRGRHEFARQGMALASCMGEARIGLDDASVLAEGTSSLQDMDDEVIIRATSGFRTVLSEATLMSLFPHLAQHPALLYKLRGKTLVGNQHVDFTFDCRSKHAVKIEIIVDFFEAFLQLLPRPSEIMTLFGPDTNPILQHFQPPRLDSMASADKEAAVQAASPSKPLSETRIFVEIEPEPEVASEVNDSHGEDKMSLGHILGP